MGKINNALSTVFVTYLLITMLSSCKSVRYIPVPSIQKDSIYRNHYIRDSIFIRDSIATDKWVQNDTVFVKQVKTKYKYSYKMKHDTLSITRVDSVNVPYPVEKSLKWWQKAYLNLLPAITIIFAVMAGIIAWLIKHTSK